VNALRTRLTGLAALTVIAGIVVGLPAALVAVGTPLLPSSRPSVHTLWSLLVTPDDGTLVLAAVTLIGWVAWAFLTGSILLEVLARARRVRAPRLPGLSLPQHAARSLVATTLLLFVTAGITAPTLVVAAPATSTAAPAGTTAQHRAPTHPDRTRHDATHRSTPPVRPAATTVSHTVVAGETLWSIAQRHLGSGQRYRDIVALNPDLLHGRGAFITPGWVLQLPAPDQPTRQVIVQPGDTLSGIAQSYLGVPDRYPEIAAASRATTQPGGVHLSDPDVIDVGWTLTLPTATPTHHHAVTHNTDKAPGAPRPADPTAATPTPHSARATPPVAGNDAATPPSTAPTGRATNASPAPAQPAPTTAAEAPHPDGLDIGSAWPVRTAYGAGALLAAGLIGLIATRRRTQHRHRLLGQHLPMPTAATAAAEQDLRTAADILSVEAVDTALRGLARDCATAGTPLPVVRAARLTGDQFELYLAHPADLPAPWTGTADAAVWTLQVDNITDLTPAEVIDVPAPYPALVTIGHDLDGGHVLLDLEHLGCLGVIGEPDATRGVLAALAVELATSQWADDLQVTIVGAFPELEDTLQTGRIRYLPSAGRILDDLHTRAQADRDALTADDAADLQHARVTGAAPDAWPPEIVLLAGPITDRQRTQIDTLVDTLPRVALAAVTAGTGVGEWCLDLTGSNDPGTGILAPIGFQLRPQTLPGDHYLQILEVAALTDPGALTHPTTSHEPGAPTGIHPSDPDTRDTDSLDTDDAAADAAMPDTPPATCKVPDSRRPDPTRDVQPCMSTTQADPSPGAATPMPGQPTQRAPSVAADPAAATGDTAVAEAATLALVPAPPAPRILVIGPVELVHAGGTVEPSKRARLLEYAAYLALHAESSHTAIDDAIWPNRSTEDNLNTRNPATSKLRRWVGTDPDGREYLPRHQAGHGYAFDPAVRTDIDDWNDLLPAGPLHAPTENLEAALRLVRGRPFEGHHRRYYGWAEPLTQRLTGDIVDAASELANRRLAEGQWRAVEEACVIGLRIEPAHERLWRLRILAAHRSHNPDARNEAIDRLLSITEELECDLEPETETLLDAVKNPGTGVDQYLATAR